MTSSSTTSKQDDYVNLFTDEEEDEDELEDDLRPTSSTSTSFKRVGSARFANRVSSAASSSAFKRAGLVRLCQLAVA